MVYVNSFDSVKESDVEYVGIKGVNVSQIYKKYNTPKGFIVSTGAFSAFIERSGIKPKIAAEISKIKTGNLHTIANEIQKLIVETPFPEFISREISDNYLNLKKDFNSKTDISVAIRSSYTKEINHKDVSQLTFLNVQNKDNVLMAIKVAWASVFTYKNMKVREELKLGHNLFNAIIIQGMVYPDKSLLVYNFNPENGDLSKIYIKSIFGIGEGFMYPETPYDSYIVDKSNFNIIKKDVVEQHFSYGLNKKNGKIAKFILNNKEISQKLNDTEIVEISKFAESITKNSSKNIRLEIGIVGEKVFIFQSKEVVIEIKPIKINVLEKQKVEEIIKKEDVVIVNQPDEKIEVFNKENNLIENIDVIRTEFVEQIKKEMSQNNENEFLKEKTLLEIAEDEMNDEEKSYDKDIEDAYIELKDIKSDFKKQLESKEEKTNLKETEKVEEIQEPDDSIFSNMHINK